MHPRNAYSDENEYKQALRDHFAAAALPMIYRQVMNGGKDIQTLGSDYIANCAYILADAMLKAREQ